MQKRFELQNKPVVWEIEIDERHKNEMDEEQSEKREDDTKRALLKDA